MSTDAGLSDDLANLTLDSLTKLKKALQGTQHTQRKTRLRSRNDGTKNGVDRNELASEVVTNALKTLDTMKGDCKNFSEKSKKFVYEACTAGLATLYEIRQEEDMEVEKLHLSFTLKLLDVELIDEALGQLWGLYVTLPTKQRVTNSRPNYESILKLKVPKNPSPALVNLIVSCQVLLLKSAQKCAQLQYKPVSNLVIANSMRETTSGPVAWTSQLADTLRDQKMTLISKLVLALSNTASLVTAMHMRTAALRAIPQADQQYFVMLLSSYDAMKKHKREIEIVKQFGQDIIFISNKHTSAWRSDAFNKLLSNCQKVALQCKDPALSDFWNHEPSNRGSEKGIDEVVKTVDGMKTDTSETILEGMLQALPIEDHFGDAKLHKSLYSFAERLIKDARVDLLYLVVNRYNQGYDIPSSRYPARILELFLTAMKNSTIPAAGVTLPLYESFAALFEHLESWDSLVHISNSMLNSGAKYRQQQDNTEAFLTIWRRAFEIELLCHGKSERSMLLIKGEKFGLGLYSKGQIDEAARVLVKTIVLGLEEPRSRDELQKPINVLARLHLDYDQTPLDMGFGWKAQVEILSMVLTATGKSSNGKRVNVAQRILDHVWENTPWQDHPLTVLKICHQYFQICGQVYSQLVESHEHLFHQLSQKQFGNDDNIKSIAPLIKAFTLLSMATSSQKPENLFQYLQHAVDHLSKALVSDTQFDMDIMPQVTQLVEFLDLHGLHELRSKALQNVLQANLSLDSSQLAWCHREFAVSQIRLGYTGAARKELDIAKRNGGTPIEMAHILALDVEYLIDVGKVGEARDAMNKFNDCVQKNDDLRPVVINGKAAKESSAHFLERVLLYAHSTCLFARLCQLDGTGEVATVNAQRSVRFLQGYLKRNNSSQRDWRVISLLIDCMVLTAKMFERIGVVKESNYYSQEGRKLAEASNCKLRVCSVLTFEGEMNVRIGKYEQAKVLLFKCEELMEGVETKDVNFLQLVHSLALYLQRQSLFSEENVYYNVSEKAYAELVKRSAPNGHTGVDEVTEGVEKLRIGNNSTHTVGIDVVHNSILRSRVYSLGLQDDTDNAMQILERYKHTGDRTRENVLFEVSKARNHYLMARKLLTVDPVFNVIQDSALSIPSANVSNSTTKKRINSKASHNDAVKYLVEAKESLVKNREYMVSTCSSIEISEISHLLNNITILLAAVNRTVDAVGHEPNLNFTLLELSKSYSSFKDRRAMTLKKTDNDYDWPAFSRAQADDLDLDLNFDVISKIPSNWLVVSINVSSDDGNLVVSRFVNKQQPLMISLPLNRHSSRDADEDSFSFDDGLGLLNQIIDASNQSAHTTRTSQIKTKQDRQEWWEERFHLDKQLATLLHDVEYCWLGGFRGIFNGDIISKDELARFKEQIDAILQTHLPSRYKRGKAASHNTKVDIHPKIYELLMGLGNPDKFNDPGLLEDLIYFMLDILQFHGEQNAYDELDMDQIVVEFEECLRGHYSRREEDGDGQFDHTILVLDKKCRQFPWESIPLLRDKSVSRVPSLKVLSSCLDQYNQQHRLSKFHYILNPGRDLFKTQERFQDIFEGLPGWTGKSGEAPTEDEMVHALESSDVMVYMGHGGGEQYIRSARIKSLNRCCPTLLLGCSSGALEYNGDYESWGTPMNYMVAGCPMLVANMWDVTDKDTDKFSLKLLERWGVLANPGDRPVDIAKAVMECRDSCTLKHLNGSALVVYGLPLTL